jgi:hypothetical protein
MARTRAVIACTLWTDPGWRKLTVGAQWLYMALLGQPKLSLCGLLVMQPKRWVQFAEGADVGPWLDELQEADWVLVDDDTDEVLIRSFVMTDVAKTSMPVNMLKGLWSSWQAIESPELRQAVVDNVPAEVWERSAAYVPATAVEMRRSDPPERTSERPSEQALQQASEQALQQASEQASQRTSERAPELPASVSTTTSIPDPASRRTSERTSSNVHPLPARPPAAKDGGLSAGEVYAHAETRRREHAALEPKPDPELNRAGVGAARAALAHNPRENP